MPAFCASALMAAGVMSDVPTMYSFFKLVLTVLRPLAPIAIATAPKTISTAAATRPPISNSLRISPLLSIQCFCRSVGELRPGAIGPSAEPSCGEAGARLRVSRDAPRAPSGNAACEGGEHDDAHSQGRRRFRLDVARGPHVARHTRGLGRAARRYESSLGSRGDPAARRVDVRPGFARQGRSVEGAGNARRAGARVRDARAGDWLTDSALAARCRRRPPLDRVDVSARPARLAESDLRLSRAAQIPRPVSAYLERALPGLTAVPARVRVTQGGEMWLRPGGRARRFTAIQDYAVRRVAFSWRARFPLAPLVSRQVVDRYADGA